MKECISLLSREFWLNGEIQTPCCCMFIGFNDGSWQKALYNDETYAWELVDSDEIPNQNETGDSEFNYPYKQYLPVDMKSCGKLKQYNLVTNNKLILSFSGNVNLVLSYNPKTESEHIEINT